MTRVGGGKIASAPLVINSQMQKASSSQPPARRSTPIPIIQYRLEGSDQEEKVSPLKHTMMKLIKKAGQLRCQSTGAVKFYGLAYSSADSDVKVKGFDVANVKALNVDFIELRPMFEWVKQGGAVMFRAVMGTIDNISPPGLPVSKYVFIGGSVHTYPRSGSEKRSSWFIVLVYSPEGLYQQATTRQGGLVDSDMYAIVIKNAAEFNRFYCSGGVDINSGCHSVSSSKNSSGPEFACHTSDYVDPTVFQRLRTEWASKEVRVLPEAIHHQQYTVRIEDIKDIMSQLRPLIESGDAKSLLRHNLLQRQLDEMVKAFATGVKAVNSAVPKVVDGVTESLKPVFEAGVTQLMDQQREVQRDNKILFDKVLKQDISIKKMFNNENKMKQQFFEEMKKDYTSFIKELKEQSMRTEQVRNYLYLYCTTRLKMYLTIKVSADENNQGGETSDLPRVTTRSRTMQNSHSNLAGTHVSDDSTSSSPNDRSSSPDAPSWQGNKVRRSKLLSCLFWWCVLNMPCFINSPTSASAPSPPALAVVSIHRPASTTVVRRVTHHPGRGTRYDEANCYHARYGGAY